MKRQWIFDNDINDAEDLMDHCEALYCHNIELEKENSILLAWKAKAMKVLLDLEGGEYDVCPECHYRIKYEKNDQGVEKFPFISTPSSHRQDCALGTLLKENPNEQR